MENINLSTGAITPDDIRKIAEAVNELLLTTSKDPDQYQEATTLEGISSLPVFRKSGVAYELVRVALELLKGSDGKQVRLQVTPTHIQWCYYGEQWQNLISIADLQKPLMSYFTEYNVSKLHPTGGIGGTNKYDIAGAIAKIPIEQRVAGNKCTFLDNANITRTYEFQGGDATDVNAWKQIGYQGIVDAKMLLFIDLWKDKSRGYGNYNPQTGFFELYKGTPLEFTDITYEEAIAIYNVGTVKGVAQSAFRQERIRVNMPLFPLVSDMSFIAYINPYLEGFNISANKTAYLHTSAVTFKCAFEGCTNLRVLYPAFKLTKNTGVDSFKYAFDRCVKLEHVEIENITRNINLGDSPLIKESCFRFMVDNKNNIDVVTVTVHPDVYSKMTDVANVSWNKILTDAATKNLSFATKSI